MIKLLILDVDGTLTQGGIVYTANGDEIKTFDVKDGLAISSWIRLGNEVAIVTGRDSSIVERRAKELGVRHIHQGVKDKYSLLLGLCEDLDIGFENVAAMGDDLNDLKMLESVGQSFVPSDATKYLLDKVKHVTVAKGGQGAAREMIEILLSMNNQMDDFIKLWQ
ncbi:MAG: HAD-IIIA family hydrolase [Thiovulaceae bacterium]|nr:HAD-IIIA family hydrolase [Sulfurimonadaceae bacterium]